jgi:hypothetical protein
MLRFFVLTSVLLLALALAWLLFPLPLLAFEFFADLTIVRRLSLTLLSLALLLNTTTRFFRQLSLLTPISLFTLVVLELKLTLTLCVFLLAPVSFFALAVFELTLMLCFFLLALSAFLLGDTLLGKDTLLVFLPSKALSLLLESSRPISPATLAVFPFSLLAELTVILLLLLAVEAEPNTRARLAVLAGDNASSGHRGAADESGVSHEAALGLRGARDAPTHGRLSGGACGRSHGVFGGSLSERWLER